MGLDINLKYNDNIDISDDEADDIIIEITGLKSINKFIGLEDTPLYYDNGKFFKVEDNKIVYADIQWKDISGDLEDVPEIIALIEELVEKINKEVIYEYIDQHNNSQFAHPYIQNIIKQNYNTLDTKIDNTKEKLSEALNTETTNRETADNELSESIQQETLARIEADTTLQNNIDTLTNNLNIEIENRTNADNLLRDDIDNISGELAQEIIDRQTQDNLLQEQITSNYNSLDDKIDTEISNRTSADTTLQNNIDKLTQTVEDNNTAVNSRIDETNDTVSDLSDTVTSNYNTLNGKIDTEISNRTLADTTLQNNINAEALARQNADATLQDNIDALSDTVSDNYTDLDGKISYLTTTVNDNDTAINSKVDRINTTLTTNINNLSNTVSSNYTTLDTKIDNTRTSLEGDISDLSNTVSQNYTDLNNTITTSASTINSRIDSEVSTLNTAISTETANRQNADNNLQSQIDAIVSSSDVFDIVGTYAELQAYDISTVPVNDIVKVLVDSSHNNTATYYRCVETSGVKSWSYIGSEGAYYTKSESDTKFVAKTTTINNKPLSSNITLTASDVNALPDTTVIGNGILTLQKNGVNIDTFNANATANKSINITVPTDTADLTNGAGFITSASLPTVNNGTLDIQVNGTSVGTFTANQAGNTTANIVVPDSATWGNITGALSNQTDLQNALDAKQSTISDLSTIRSGASAGATALQPNDNITELVNNAGYITGITSSDVATALGYIPYNSTNPNGYITASALTPYALISSLSTVATSGSYTDLSDKPTIGNGTITFTQGGVTKGTITTNQSGNTTIDFDAGGGGAVSSVNGQTGTVVLTASDVGALADTTTIPSKTSDLTNDSGFITGITSSDVTTALGYTPYNSTNPDGYITSSALNGYATENWVNNQGYLTSVPTATTSNLGLVKPDGTTITIDSNGVLSGSTTNWGELSGDINRQKDLNIKLDAKQNVLIAGNNITLSDTTVSDWTDAFLIKNFFGGNWNGLAWNAIQGFVAITYDGYVSTSTNGTTWSIPKQNSTLGSNYNYQCMTSFWDRMGMISPMEWCIVALGHSGRIVALNAKSNEWTVVGDLGSNVAWQRITFNSDDMTLLAIGNTGYVSKSEDYSINNWSTPTQLLDSSISWGSLAYGNNTYVALGRKNSHFWSSTSSDGDTWSTPTQLDIYHASDSHNALAYDGTQFVALSYDGYISTSTDGITWSTSVQNQKLGSKGWRNLVYTDGHDSVQAVAMGFDTGFNYEALLLRNTATEISATGMPSDKYINLTVGASGTKYTAPANGWVSFCVEGNGNTYGMFGLNNLTTPDSGRISTFIPALIKGVAYRTFMPIMKNSEFSIEFYNSVTPRWLVFIYAQGSESEAS